MNDQLEGGEGGSGGDEQPWLKRPSLFWGKKLGWHH